MIEIEKGIPLPTRGAVRRKYPWAEMEVGDSFAAKFSSAGSAYATAKTGGLRNNMKFTARRIEGDEYRIWRIA